MTTCRFCGDEIRDGEDSVVVVDVPIHITCVEAPHPRTVAPEHHDGVLRQHFPTLSGGGPTVRWYAGPR